MNDSVDTSVDTLANAVIALAAQTTALVDRVADVVNTAADVVAAQDEQEQDEQDEQEQDEQIEFRHIPGLLNYFCDRSGRIWRSTSKSIKEIKPIRNPVSGYMGINIQLFDGKWSFTSGGIHKLIAQSWLGPVPAGKVVNHKNGRKDDNRVCNLEYVSPFVNAQGNAATPPARRAVPVYDAEFDIHYRSLQAAATATRKGIRTIQKICEGLSDGMFVYDEPGAIRYWLTTDESCKKGDLI